jgi:D-glycero-D-manno-heptose 1,7-bisphosphate phosphatase
MKKSSCLEQAVFFLPSDGAEFPGSGCGLTSEYASAVGEWAAYLETCGICLAVAGTADRADAFRELLARQEFSAPVGILSIPAERMGASLAELAKKERVSDLFLLDGRFAVACDWGLFQTGQRNSGQPVAAALRLRAPGEGNAVCLCADGRLVRPGGEAPPDGYTFSGAYVAGAEALPAMVWKSGWTFDQAVLSGFRECFGLALGAPWVDLCSPARSRHTMGTLVNTARRKAVFLDRDGVINLDREYLHRIEDVVFCEGIFDFCAAAQSRGYDLVVVSNQSGIARGHYDEAAVDKLHAWMQGQFAMRGVRLLDLFYCPYHEKAPLEKYRRASVFRKPEPGMLLAAAEKWNIDLARSFMVGDRPSDRIRLPYLRSYIIQTPKADWECDADSLEALRKKAL